jgi:hypothetical protein
LKERGLATGLIDSVVGHGITLARVGVKKQNAGRIFRPGF